MGSYGLGIQILDAQTVTGRITDRKSCPVTGATVVLQAPDSTFVSAAVSDADGHFTLPAQPEQYRLIVQHLLYRSQTVNGTGKDAGTIVLQPADRTIGEVVVKAERPIVRVEEGRLNYDLEQIVRDKVVNNTYEALQRLPGVQEIGGKLTLAGVGEVTVILNGKPTTMDAGQLETLLRNTPVSRVEKVEVMYSTPPQYHVRGASLNVVLKRPNDYSFQGEVNVTYDNCYFNAGNATGNFRFSTPKLALDAMYGIDRVHTMQYYNLFSRHTLDGQIYSIEENEQLRNKAYRHNMRVAGEYHFNENSSIDLAYTGKYMPNIQEDAQTTGNFQTSDIDGRREAQMHNIALHLRSGFGLDAGGDYTHYTTDNRRWMHAEYADGNRNRFTLAGGQRIDRYNVYADQKHKLSQGWNLGYGVSYTQTHNHDFQTYTEVEGDIATPSTDSKLKEQTTDFYVSLGKDYPGGISFMVGIGHRGVLLHRQLPQMGFLPSGFPHLHEDSRTHPATLALHPKDLSGILGNAVFRQLYQRIFRNMGHTRIASSDELQCECQLHPEAEVCLRRILLPYPRPVHADCLSVHRTVSHDLQDDELELHTVRRPHGHGAVPGRNVVGFPLGSGGTIRTPPLRRLFRPSFRPEKVDFAVPMGQHVQAEQESGFRIARIHADSGHTRYIRPENGGYGRCRGEMDLCRRQSHTLCPL